MYIALRLECIAASQHTSKPARTPSSQPASHLACLVFPHFCSPDFAQAPRKVWRKVCKLFNTSPVFDSKGTSASNHSCIKPARASLLVAPISLSLYALCKKNLGRLYLNVNRVWRKLGAQAAQGKNLSGARCVANCVFAHKRY